MTLFWYLFQILLVTSTFEHLRLFSKALYRDIGVFLHCPIVDGLLDGIPGI